MTMVGIHGFSLTLTLLKSSDATGRQTRQAYTLTLLIGSLE